jgi:mRNA interferase RelE/StbE
MKTVFKSSFLRGIKKVKDKRLKDNIANTIEFIENVSNISEISNIEKIKTNKTYFRIRIGDYRIGAKIEKNTVTFAAFGHRKDIYKHFP